MYNNVVKISQNIGQDFFLSSINLIQLTLDRQTDITCADYCNVIIFRKKQFLKNKSFTNFWFMGSRN